MENKKKSTYLFYNKIINVVYIGDQEICCICLRNLKRMFSRLNCEHDFCFTCIDEWSLASGEKKCPICRRFTTSIERVYNLKF